MIGLVVDYCVLPFGIGVQIDGERNVRLASGEKLVR